jgi:hypothetical protein
MKIILLIGVAIAFVGFVYFTPAVNDVLNSFTPVMITPITANITTYTANGTVIYGMGTLQNAIGSNFGLWIMLIALCALIYAFIKIFKGAEETE